ncbi:MAG: peptidylprolyl isomerase [candidate division KSB1 bacterium]|nr:peptidylprolyl isomerase [candidate division KSB1 bacterium]MDZ7302105.1 peptidylprolyl isomerase [candidate division KSB1 bacterium]MDZ7311146.1 peptidylprolyl isomerase [candidate division KSB1 bacterium]
MKKFWQGLIVGVVATLIMIVNVLPSLIPAGQAQQEAFYQGKTVFVKVAEENLRAAPAPTGDRLGVIFKGTSMVVLQDQGKWLFVNLRGFIWKESVTGEKGVFRGQPYRAAMILVKTEAEAQDILRQLQAGADFAKLATKSIGPNPNKGGDLGDAYPGDFSKEYETAILALKVGEISGIIKTANGFHIFKRLK